MHSFTRVPSESASDLKGVCMEQFCTSSRMGSFWMVAVAQYTPLARAPAVWLARSGNAHGILLA